MLLDFLYTWWCYVDFLRSALCSRLGLGLGFGLRFFLGPRLGLGLGIGFALAQALALALALAFGLLLFSLLDIFICSFVKNSLYGQRISISLYATETTIIRLIPPLTLKPKMRPSSLISITRRTGFPGLQVVTFHFSSS